jgi:hypothetical protein
MWYKVHSPAHFRRKVRVAPETFDCLVYLIEGHSVFHNNSNNQQMPIPVQLAIFLNRLGHYGNSATLDDIAEWAGVSSGTVSNCTQRCMMAFLSLHNCAIRPPSAEEKELSKQYTEATTLPEWRGRCLAIDGSTIPLFQKPGLYGDAWFDKTSNYSINVQVKS